MDDVIPLTGKETDVWRREFAWTKLHSQHVTENGP